jgi:hypothetical protein
MSNNQTNRIQFIASFDRYSYVEGQLEKQAVFRSIRINGQTEILKELAIPAEVEDMPESFRVNETALFSAEITLDNITFISSLEFMKDIIAKGEVQND